MSNCEMREFGDLCFFFANIYTWFGRLLQFFSIKRLLNSEPSLLNISYLEHLLTFYCVYDLLSSCKIIRSKFPSQAALLIGLSCLSLPTKTQIINVVSLKM